MDEEFSSKKNSLKIVLILSALNFSSLQKSQMSKRHFEEPFSVNCSSKNVAKSTFFSFFLRIWRH